MSPTLSDMDSFSLNEIDDFTIKDLDRMSYEELYNAVQAKYRIANERCNKDTPLSDGQIQAVTAIVHAYASEQHVSKTENLTINIATQLIGSFLIWCVQKTVENFPEIVSALKQAYALLEQLIQQAG